MKKFILHTHSESGDHYLYCIEHPKTPTKKELEKFLFEQGHDRDEDQSYEYVQDIQEITEFYKLK